MIYNIVQFESDFLLNKRYMFEIFILLTKENLMYDERFGPHFLDLMLKPSLS
ncbi:hypothetical protein Hdeb2414_s0025g00661521 [Helianthus debilis subsp. tardiflorus]